MCFIKNLFKKKEVVPVEPIRISRSPYKEGDRAGNIPSPRVDIKPEDVVYDRATKTLVINNIEPEVIVNTVQNTNSMEPLPDVGHMVVCSNNAKYMKDLTVGDVIIFDAGDGLTIIHSISDMTRKEGKNIYFTHGWNLKNPDPYTIYEEQILWVVLLYIPSKGYHGMIASEGD